MLLSFAFDDVRRALRSYRQTMPCGRLMVDSGAYTAFTVGQPINLGDYAAFLADHLDCWDAAVTLDVIGDPVGTRRNTLTLHAKGLKVMPVFTRGGSVAEFDAMVRDSGYVCVGGGVGMPPKIVVSRLSALQRRAEELGGGIHALGVGSLPQIRAIRPYSADASNISGAFMFGSLTAYDGTKIVNIALNDTAKLRRYLVHLKAAGIELGSMVTTRRLPKKYPRRILMRGMSLGHACADEDTVRLAAPVPTGVNDTQGTHMFSAVTGGFLAPAVAELDKLLHDPGWNPPPMWKRYGNRHAAQCRATVAAAA